MILEKIKTALTNEINPKINNHGKNKLASVLIIIYYNPPKIFMTKKQCMKEKTKLMLLKQK